MIQFDEHIFQISRNHQLDSVCLSIFCLATQNSFAWNSMPGTFCAESLINQYFLENNIQVFFFTTAPLGSWKCIPSLQISSRPKTRPIGPQNGGFVSEKSSEISGKPRFVKYYNLARIPYLDDQILQMYDDFQWFDLDVCEVWKRKKW